MKKLGRKSLYTLALAAMMMVGGTAVAQEAEQNTILGLLEDLMEADNRGDLQAVMGFYSKDAILMPPDAAPITGWQRVEDHYRHLFEHYAFSNLDAQVEEAQVMGEMGFIAGTTNGTITARDGSSIQEINSKFIMHLRQGQGEGWKIKRLIWNDNKIPEPATTIVNKPTNKDNYPMQKIIHVFTVNTPASKVYQAITTGKGLAGWWSTKVTAQEKLDGIVDFTFRGDFNPDMKIIQLKEGQHLAWKCVNGADPWQDNIFTFDLVENEGSTQVTFVQEYANEIGLEAYGIFNFNWGYYLQSLKDYCETGKGKPYQP